MPITTPTVLILGAGASSDYGFPLGVDLRNQVCLFCQGHGRQLLGDMGHTESHVDSFLAELRYSGFRSVDAFLEHNPAFLEVGKHAIAASLLPYESEDSLFPPRAPANHWYELLANKMGAGSDSWSENQLAIVTFNYDRSLEHYFTRVIAQRRGVGLGRAHEELQHIPTIHVHGRLGLYHPEEPGALPYAAPVTAHTVQGAAKEMLVVSEVADTLPTFDQALEVLSAAKRIYFLGFGFYPDNVRRLRFFESRRPADGTPFVSGTVDGLSEREWRTIERTLLHGQWSTGRHMNVYGFLREWADLD